MHLFMKNILIEYVSPYEEQESDVKKTEIKHKPIQKNPSLEYETMLKTIETIKGVLEHRLLKDPSLKGLLLPTYIGYKAQPKIRPLPLSVFINVDSYRYSHRDVKIAVDNKLSAIMPLNGNKYVKMIQFLPYKLEFHWISEIENRWIIQLNDENHMQLLIDTGLKILGDTYLVRDYMDIQRFEIQLWRETYREYVKPLVRLHRP